MSEWKSDADLFALCTRELYTPVDMDFDAGRVLAGDVSLAQAGRELAEMIVRVAGGEPSKPERLGHREYFIMYKHQNIPSLMKGCRT